MSLEDKSLDSHKIKILVENVSRNAASGTGDHVVDHVRAPARARRVVLHVAITCRTNQLDGRRNICCGLLLVHCPLLLRGLDEMEIRNATVLLAIHARTQKVWHRNERQYADDHNHNHDFDQCKTSCLPLNQPSLPHLIHSICTPDYLSNFASDRLVRHLFIAQSGDSI